MYNSLKSWVDIPVTVKSFIKRNSTGEPIYGDIIKTFCYPRARADVAMNRRGVEVKSNTQLYMDGIESIKEEDAVIFEDFEYIVKAVITFYRAGTADIKVVFI